MLQSAKGYNHIEILVGPRQVVSGAMFKIGFNIFWGLRQGILANVYT
ncbi:hypothetical protein ES703_95161 [subsurface metagenome]